MRPVIVPITVKRNNECTSLSIHSEVCVVDIWSKEMCKDLNSPEEEAIFLIDLNRRLSVNIGVPEGGTITYNIAYKE